MSDKYTKGWTEQDFQEECEYALKVNPDDMKNQSFSRVWNVSENAPLKVRFELWGNSYVHYGLVIFVDNKPVSVAPEDLMFLTVEEGYKTVVEAEIDMTGFNGESIVYATLIPRNVRSAEVHTYSWLDIIEEYQLFAENPAPPAH